MEKAVRVYMKIEVWVSTVGRLRMTHTQEVVWTCGENGRNRIYKDGVLE